MGNSTIYYLLSYYPWACIILCAYAGILSGISLFEGLINLLKTYFGHEQFRFYYLIKFGIAGAVACRYYGLYCDKEATLPLILADPAQATLQMVFSLCLPIAFFKILDILLLIVSPQKIETPLTGSHVFKDTLKDKLVAYLKGQTQTALKSNLRKGHQQMVLVIDGEKSSRRFVKKCMEKNNFMVVEAENGGQGLSLAASGNPDLILLDSKLPDIDGLLVLRRLREWTQTPVILLAKENEKIVRLDTVAVYYLTKPFTVRELMDQIHLVLRPLRYTAQREVDPVFVTPDFKVDLSARVVTARHREVHLTPHEYNLLAFLVGHAGKVVTRKMVNNEFWGHHIDEDGLRHYIHQLRKKIEYDPVLPKYILTEPGTGYRLKHK